MLMVLFNIGCVAGKDEWKEKIDEDGRKVQSMQIQAPTMTEEDQFGYTMPDQYRCDACKAVVHHLNEALERRQPKNRRLHEWEYTELFDETCKSGFTGYGVSLVNGQNMLSGPGIQRDNNIEPGMGAIQMGGETWEKRLGEQCRKFVYEKVGEDDVYEEFRSSGKLTHNICFQTTRDCKAAKLGPDAPPSEPKAKKSPGKATAKKVEDKSSKPEVTEANIEPKMDLSTFISKLAKKNGASKAEYTKKRSYAEWEQFMASVMQKTNSKPSVSVIDV